MASLLDLKNRIAAFLQERWDRFANPDPITIYADDYQKPQPQVAPQQTPQPNFDENMVRQAIGVYGGGSPFEQYAPQIAQAYERYPFLRNNPELIPLIGHLETSSGRNVTRPNNLLNWGINYPGNNPIFATMSPEAVLERALSGLGQRSPYYKQFRTGQPLTDEELMQFGNIYEPANRAYGPNLVQGRRFIRGQLGL